MSSVPVKAIEAINHIVRETIKNELHLKVEPGDGCISCKSLRIQMMLGKEEVGEEVIITGSLYASHGNWASPDSFTFRVDGFEPKEFDE